LDIESSRRDVPTRADFAFKLCIQFAIARPNDRQPHTPLTAIFPLIGTGQYPIAPLESSAFAQQLGCQLGSWSAMP